MRRGPSRSRRRRHFLAALGVGVLIVAVLAAQYTARRPPGGVVATNYASGTSGPTAPAAPARRNSANIPPLVFTYFFYWYDLPRGVHSTELTDHPINPNASCRSVDWFKQQFSDMEDAGIDVALADYWGAQEPCSDIGITNMALALQQLRAAGKHPPRVGMVVDTGLIGNWPVPERDLTKAPNQQRVYDLVHTFYSLLPKEDWAFVENRPIVWFWAAYFDITFDRTFFTTLDKHFAADFSYHPYIVGESSFRFAITWTPSGRQMNKQTAMPLDDYYEWGATLRGYSDDGGNIAEVGPGYDERRLTGPDRVGRYQSRENGQFYEHNLQAAINSGQPYLAIETWDEFHEATDVADTVEYGRQYIDITRRYVDQFRASRKAVAGACNACPTTTAGPGPS